MTNILSGVALNSTHSLACCFQLCVKLHRSPTMKELVYMTHYKSTSHCSLNALSLGSIALPLLALSVVSQTSPVNHLQFRGQKYSIKNQVINNTQ